jgi:hypothetical protein
LIVAEERGLSTYVNMAVCKRNLAGTEPIFSLKTSFATVWKKRC